MKILICRIFSALVILIFSLLFLGLYIYDCNLRSHNNTLNDINENRSIINKTLLNISNNIENINYNLSGVDSEYSETHNNHNTEQDYSDHDILNNNKNTIFMPKLKGGFEVFHNSSHFNVSSDELQPKQRLDYGEGKELGSKEEESYGIMKSTSIIPKISSDIAKNSEEKRFKLDSRNLDEPIELGYNLSFTKNDRNLRKNAEKSFQASLFASLKETEKTTKKSKINKSKEEEDKVLFHTKVTLDMLLYGIEPQLIDEILEEIEKSADTDINVKLNNIMSICIFKWNQKNKLNIFSEQSLNTKKCEKAYEYVISILQEIKNRRLRANIDDQEELEIPPQVCSCIHNSFNDKLKKFVMN